MTNHNALRRARRLGPMGYAASLTALLFLGCSSAEISNGGSGGPGQGGNGQSSGQGGGTGGAFNPNGGSAGAQNIGGQASGSGGAGQTGGSQAGSGGQGGARPDAGSAGAGGVRSDASAGNRPDGGSDASAGTGGIAGTAPPCLNGRKDGTETGVDCGGSCGACPSYMINAPNRNNMAQSSCQGGTGYMCARSMLFSPEFKQAAMDDWGAADPPFVYATAGHDPDTGGLDTGGGNTCCQCYQLIFETPVGATGIPVPKPMIVQVFNTAAGGGRNFDIYMAAGGFGANNGCTGGSPMYSQFPDLGGDFSGGVKATRYSQCSGGNNQFNLASVSSSTCQSYVASQCSLIQSTASMQNQSTSQGSCLESNFPESHYHINWSVRAKRVECPTNLTRVTGCKLNNQGLPAATPTAQNVASADSTFRTGYGTTTMQDCCRPTCAYPTNVSNADPSWSIFYTCDRAGTPQ